MMRPEEHIKLAENLCVRLRSASAEVGPKNRPRQVRGVDPNELKKLLTFLLKHRDLNKLRKLVEKLPNSNFARRSGLTEGYYKNIQTALGADFFRLSSSDAVFVLGWVCRFV